jgi:hypothetical protein
MKKAFLLISAGMLSYLGPGGMAVASEVPSELSEEPITLPVSGSSSRSTSNSAGTTINQQTNTQDNNDQFHGFGLGIRCPTPTLGFSLYGGGGAGGSGLDGGVSTSAYGGMITLNLPLGNRNRRTCAELGEAQLRAVQAQTERTQLEAAKVRTDINLVTLQQCITILQTARLSGRFADACAGVDLAAQGQTPQFSDRSQPGAGGAVIALSPPPPSSQPLVRSASPDQLPSNAQPRPTGVDDPASPPSGPDSAIARTAQAELPAIAPPPTSAVADGPGQESPPTHQLSLQASRTSLPSIARVLPPVSSAPISAPPQTAPGVIAPSPAVVPPAPPETTLSPMTELPVIARLPTHRPRPTATVSSPEHTGGVEFARSVSPPIAPPSIAHNVFP